MVTSLSGVSHLDAKLQAEPRLVRAAHEFESQLMKELLKPLTCGEVSGSDPEGSAGALGEYAGDALGQALSEEGGLGIARTLLTGFPNPAFRPLRHQLNANDHSGHSFSFQQMTKVMLDVVDEDDKESCMDIRSSMEGLRSLLGASSSSVASVQQGKQSHATENSQFSSDRATLSSAGTLVSQSADDSGVRMDKVAAIRSALASGTYNVPASAVASKMVDSMLSQAK